MYSKTKVFFERFYRMQAFCITNMWIHSKYDYGTLEAQQ